MFKNRALQVQMVKKNKQNTPDETVECTHFDVEEINQIAKTQVQHIAIAVGAVFAANKFLSTVSEIAVITARAKIQ